MRSITKGAKQLRSQANKSGSINGASYLRSKKGSINDQRRTNFFNGKKYKQAPDILV